MNHCLYISKLNQNKKKRHQITAQSTWINQERSFNRKETREEANGEGELRWGFQWTVELLITGGKSEKNKRLFLDFYLFGFIKRINKRLFFGFFFWILFIRLFLINVFVCIAQ